MSLRNAFTLFSLYLWIRFVVPTFSFVCEPETGKAVAERTYERHKMFAQMLSSMGVNEETAVQDACRMEHAVSDESFAAMKKFFARIGQFESV